MSSLRTAMPAAGPDAARETFTRGLCAEEARALSEVQNWRGAWAIAFQWSVIAAAASAAIMSGHWLVYLFAIVVIGTRQQALLILVHEATHYRLFTSRRLNDLVGNLALAYPTGVSLSRYRPFHLDHHRYSYTDHEKDPEWRYIQANADWQWPKTPAEAACIVAMDLVGLNLLTLLRLMRQFSPWFIFFNGKEAPEHLETGERILLLAFAGALLAALALTGGWLQFALLWLLPLATVTTALFRLRTVTEHAGLAGEHELNSTRSVLPGWFGRLILAPCNVNYHLEHHLYPSVPFYNLPRLHRRLMDEPAFRQTAHLSPGYAGPGAGALREITRTSRP